MMGAELLEKCALPVGQKVVVPDARPHEDFLYARKRPGFAEDAEVFVVPRLQVGTGCRP